MKPRQFIAPLGLVLLLCLLGGYLYLQDAPVFWPGFAAMVVFYGLIFGMGSYAAGLRRGDSSSDVLLAGRALPLGVAIFTMSATWLGGGFINGTAEQAYSNGLVWVQAPWGYGISLIIGGLFFARKMRRYRFRTMLDPLSQRFGKRLTGILFLPALTGELFWSAAILTALGTTFGTVLGLDSDTAIVVSALVAVTYTILGGLWAVALTDVVQLVLLFIGLLLVLPFAIDQLGDWDSIWTQYQAEKGAAASVFPSREALGSYYWNWWDFAFLLILGGIPWQVYFQRVLASKDEKTAMWLSILAGLICIMAAIPAGMIGIIGSVFQQGGAEAWQAVGAEGAPAEAAEILPYVLRYLSDPWVATIGLGAIAAAVMSSTDSSILSASSMLIWNIYRPLRKKEVEGKALSRLIQRSVALIGVAATLLALQVGSVYELWFLCSDFVYCLLFPALFTALFDKKANWIGALTGLLVAAVLRFGGGEASLGLPVFLDYPVLDAVEEFKNGERVLVLFPFRSLAMLSGLLSIVLVSRLTQRWAPARALAPEDPLV